MLRIPTVQSAVYAGRDIAYDDRFASESNPTPLTVGGRLGSYAHYDMDKSIAAALAVDIATWE